nr:MAG TPA: hypothetical protein [Caudoviricetes sp.]
MNIEFKYKDIPPFSKRDGDSLLFSGDGYLEYYIPDEYFGSKSSTVEGSYLKILGSFNYRIFDAKGKPGKLKEFNYPTLLMCKPGKVERNVKLQLDPSLEESVYGVLRFFDGDQLISRLHTEQYIDNVSELFRLHLRTGNVPNTIPYDTLYAFPFESMELNGGKFAVHSQAMGLMYSKICRDPDDINKPFRLSKAIDNSMQGYRPISIKRAAKLISPFVAMTAENIDESIMVAVMMSDDEKNGKSKHKESPLERIMTM